MSNALDGIVLVGLIIFVLHSCNKDPKETQEYKDGRTSGYEEGYQYGTQDGRAKGKREVCNRIEGMNYRIYSAVTNEGACP